MREGRYWEKERKRVCKLYGGGNMYESSIESEGRESGAGSRRQNECLGEEREGEKWMKEERRLRNEHGLKMVRKHREERDR